MTRASVAAAVCLVLLAFGCGGCREEPTIVIKFEPSDMSGVKKADMSKPNDLAAPPDLAPVAKAGPPECKKAADCTVEPDECCACTSGGKQHAVAKKKLAALEAARKKKCEHTMCPMFVSHDLSCAEVPDCVAGQCTLVPKKQK